MAHTPDGLEAVVFTADGDMRQALNNLQVGRRRHSAGAARRGQGAEGPRPLLWLRRFAEASAQPPHLCVRGC